MNPKVAVITGAASGIGFALAKSCALRNMHVVMMDNDVPALHVAADEIRQASTLDVLAVACNVTRLDDVQSAARQVYEHFQRVDFLFNNAGISGPLTPLWEVPIEQARQVIDVNVFGVLHGIQVFLPLMFQQDFRSHVINMASVYGLCSGSLVGAYAMSKHAIVAMSESLFFDVQRLNKPVDVSVICPSFVNTPLLEHSHLTPNDTFHQKMHDLFSRSKTPEDVAEHILREVANKQFYIFPDKEVKDYCEQRLKGFLDQSHPTQHSLEKIMAWVARS